MSSRKRKSRPRNNFQDEIESHSDPALYIQAHEADIIQAKKAADSLEASGSGLTQRNLQPAGFTFYDDDNDFAAPLPQPADSAAAAVWVDRHDARLLPDALPPKSASPPPPAASPSGESDLPSDSFSPDEADEYQQKKRRRLMDQAREARLEARRREDEENGVLEEEGAWGGSDEEPDEAQTELMKRTAQNLAVTTNPALLEMRILANYGADKRFAFLRGRWKGAWGGMKREAQAAKEGGEGERPGTKKAADTNATPGGGLGNLADYGDSDDEEREDPGEEEPPTTEQIALAARQERARAWAESRRASKFVA